MIHRVPSCEDCGLKDDFNGPICYTPDGNPLVGPAPGLRNMWLAEGFSVLASRQRAAWDHYMAQMMGEGEAEIDMASLDPKRYGSWMTTEYGARKNEECYSIMSMSCTTRMRNAKRRGRFAPHQPMTGRKALGAQFGLRQRLGAPQLLWLA